MYILLFDYSCLFYSSLQHASYCSLSILTQILSYKFPIRINYLYILGKIEEQVVWNPCDVKWIRFALIVDPYLVLTANLEYKLLFLYQFQFLYTPSN